MLKLQGNVSLNLHCLNSPSDLGVFYEFFFFKCSKQNKTPNKENKMLCAIINAIFLMK